jgi:hypothetical protein
MKTLRIEGGDSVYEWSDDAAAWEHVGGPPAAVALPPVPPSHIPDAAGFMATTPGYLTPWAVVQAPTPRPAGGDDVSATRGPMVY